MADYDYYNLEEEIAKQKAEKERRSMGFFLPFYTDRSAFAYGYVCDECGAIIFNAKLIKHYEWHRTIPSGGPRA